MEQENRRITWKEVTDRVKDLDPTLKYYGVPRGGSVISAMINPVDTPEEADIIIDDLIDSGATRERYKKYGKPFIGLFESGDTWLEFPWEAEEQPAEDNIIRILEYINENPNREGLKDTPRRYLKFLKEFLNPPEFNFTTFTDTDVDQMIVMTDIPFFSMCEHHMAPFFGTAKIGYIPNGKIVGLSKLARTLELYSRRLQNQERITRLVAERLTKELDPLGVGVQLTAEHLCMSMRGVKKPGSKTTTTHLTGLFREGVVRNEFLDV